MSSSDPRSASSPVQHSPALETTAAAGTTSPDGHGTVYRETLHVAWWGWLLVLFVAATAFIALAPISLVLGALVAVVLAALIGVGMVVGSPKIELTDTELRVGRAYIERRFVGHAEALTGSAARAARGPELDGRAFMNFRVSVPSLCRIEILDPVDPTPYWLTATRHPDRLAAAINGGLGDSPRPRDAAPGGSTGGQDAPR